MRALIRLEIAIRLTTAVAIAIGELTFFRHVLEFIVESLKFSHNFTATPIQRLEILPQATTTLVMVIPSIAQMDQKVTASMRMPTKASALTHQTKNKIAVKCGRKFSA